MSYNYSPYTEEILNSYVYNQITKPTDLTSESLIRPASTTAGKVVPIDQTWYMTDSAEAGLQARISTFSGEVGGLALAANRRDRKPGCEPDFQFSAWHKNFDTPAIWRSFRLFRVA
jgi:hypothetical protein